MSNKIKIGFWEEKKKQTKDQIEIKRNYAFIDFSLNQRCSNRVPKWHQSQIQVAPSCRRNYSKLLEIWSFGSWWLEKIIEPESLAFGLFCHTSLFFGFEPIIAFLLKNKFEWKNHLSLIINSIKWLWAVQIIIRSSLKN